MSDNKSKTYSEEFRQSSIKLALESKHPVAQTARNLGINANTLYTWMDKAKPKEQLMVNDKTPQDEVKQLRKELAKMTQERDLLKKVAAYFAKDSQ